MKYCKDCKYFKSDKSWYWFLVFPFFLPFFYWISYKPSIRFGKCSRSLKEDAENNTTLSPIFKTKKVYWHASVVRMHDCGPAAIWFESKQGENYVILLQRK